MGRIRDAAAWVAGVAVSWAACLGIVLAPPPAARRRRRGVQTAVVLLGAAACVTCTETDSTLVYVVNVTRFPMELGVRPLSGVYDCQMLTEEGAKVLEPEDFDAAETHAIGPLETATIVNTWNSPEECGAALLEADGLDGLVVSWQDLTPVSIEEPWDARGTDVQGIVLRGAGDRLVPSVGSALASFDAAELGEREQCDEPAGSPLTWRFADGTFDVRRVTYLGGCVTVSVAPAEPDATQLVNSQAEVCAPQATFPFVAGDRIVVAGARDEELIITDINSPRRQVRYRAGVAPKALTEGPCFLELPCGALVMPVAVSSGFAMGLRAGESATSEADVRLTFFVLRAERVLREGDCHGRSLGTTYDSALVTEPIAL